MTLYFFQDCADPRRNVRVTPIRTIFCTLPPSTGPTTTSFTVWRLRQQVFIQGKGRSNVEINAKENARVGQAVLPSHPLSMMSTVVSVSVMDGKLTQISVLPKTRLIKLPTYPDGASQDGSKARWRISYLTAYSVSVNKKLWKQLKIK